MKILYVTTVSDTMGFFIPHIKMLLEEGYSVDLACNIRKPIPLELLNLGCNAYDIEFQRSPLKAENLVAYQKLKDLIYKNGYDVVHTHTPVASVFSRLACKNLKNVKVIYTAHGFHFYKGAPILNWLVYYPVEKWLSRYTDILITINQEDYNRARNSFKAGKVKYIPGVGLDVNKYKEVKVDRLKKRRELDIPENSFVLLSVGELNSNKNHEVIIRALAKMNNPNIFYVVCGSGPLEKKLTELINRLGLVNQVKLLGYRNDIIEICKIVDLFIFPSYREGLPVSLMEAMAAGLPVVCSDIRGNNDLIKHGKGGYLVKPYDISNYVHLINELYHSKDVVSKFGLYNLTNIYMFDIKIIIEDMSNIYNKFKDDIRG